MLTFISVIENKNEDKSHNNNWENLQNWGNRLIEERYTIVQKKLNI